MTPLASCVLLLMPVRLPPPLFFFGGSGPCLPSLSGARMLQLQLSSWLLGVLVLAVGILLPLGLAASRNKVLQQAWEKATGKTV